MINYTGFDALDRITTKAFNYKINISRYDYLILSVEWAKPALDR